MTDDQATILAGAFVIGMFIHGFFSLFSHPSISFESDGPGYREMSKLGEEISKGLAEAACISIGKTWKYSTCMDE